jgi:hypothetical protein
MDEELRTNAQKIIEESPERAEALLEAITLDLSRSAGKRASREEAREVMLQRVMNLLQRQLDLIAEHFTEESVESLREEEPDVEKAVPERIHAEMARIYPRHFT